MNQHKRFQPRLNKQQYTSVNSYRGPVLVFAEPNRDSRLSNNELFRSEWRDPVGLRFSSRTN